MHEYARRTRTGEAILPPCDVLIARDPLRTRQPDGLFISKDQLTFCGKPDEPLPLLAAPELVVETLFPGEDPRQRADKIADYCAVGVHECWIANRDANALEVLRLSRAGAELVAVYERGQTVTCLTFADLFVPVDDIFAE